MLEDERNKNKSPPRKAINPNVPNEDLIAKMKEERQKRYDLEAKLKELAENGGEDEDSDD